MKTTVKGFVYLLQYEWEDKPRVTWFQSATIGAEDPQYTLVGPHNFDVEVPDDFDPRPAKIAALKEKERRVRAEFGKHITEIQEQLAKLQAITYQPEGA